MNDDLVYLKHIRDAADDIARYTRGGEEHFFKEKMVQDAVIRKLEIIGEAVKNISNTTREKYPEIPWKQIAGLRDVLIHQNFGVDLDTVWLVVHKRLPPLSNLVDQLLAAS